MFTCSIDRSVVRGLEAMPAPSSFFPLSSTLRGLMTYGALQGCRPEHGWQLPKTTPRRKQLDLLANYKQASNECEIKSDLGVPIR